MGQRSKQDHLRLLAVALALGLLWLAQQAGRAGIAGIYGDSAAQYQQQMSDKPAQIKEYASEGAGKIAIARRYAPGHADYALQAATFAAAGGNYQEAIPLLQHALADSPVRADLWSRLASYAYAAQGTTDMTVHALDSALYFGPREYDAHLANATIILGSGNQLDVARRVRGWNDLVAAAAMPQLAQSITDMASAAGLERQLQTQVREKASARAALEQRDQDKQRQGQRGARP